MEKNQGGKLDSWHSPSPTPLLEHSSCPPAVGSRARPLLLTQMSTHFVPSVEACFSFPFACCIPSPSASDPFLAQLLTVSLGPFFFSWAHKHPVNLQVSRSRLPGQEGNRQTWFLNMCTSLGAGNHGTISLLWDKNLC